MTCMPTKYYRQAPDCFVASIGALRTATGPVMSPPYVHRHPLILSANVEVNLEADDQAHAWRLP
jgi:hypothetical protein